MFADDIIVYLETPRRSTVYSHIFLYMGLASRESMNCGLKIFTLKKKTIESSKDQNSNLP